MPSRCTLHMSAGVAWQGSQAGGRLYGVCLTNFISLKCLRIQIVNALAMFLWFWSIETLEAVRCFALGLERKSSYNVVRGMRSNIACIGAELVTFLSVEYIFAILGT